MWFALGSSILPVRANAGFATCICIFHICDRFGPFRIRRGYEFILKMRRSSTPDLENGGISLHSRPSVPPPPSSSGAVVPNNAFVDYLSLATGNSKTSRAEAASVMQSWLKHQIRRDFQAQIIGSIHEEFYANEDEMERIFRLMEHLVQDLLKNHGASIDSIVRRLTTGDVLLERLSSSSMTRRVIFNCLGLVTMIYSPLAGTDENFEIRTSRAPFFLQSSIEESLADRSMTELLREMGNLLPCRNFSGESRSRVHLASINFATHSHIGGIKIVWVDNFSSHLTLDASTSKLYLFCYPSFCTLHRTTETMLNRLEWETPYDFHANRQQDPR